MKVTDKVCVNYLKTLGIDIIDKAKSGHPGIVLGAANIMYTLYTKILKIDPRNPKWLNRDRFVMSCGHGSALLYAMLYLSGYDLNESDLKAFRKINSFTPGHPEYGVTPGVDASTGPLGQGIGNAVGMALAERYLHNYYESIKGEDDENLFDYHTFVLCGDGDLMEGVSYESLSFAGKENLNKLIVLYDSNNISLDGSTDISFTEDVTLRMESFGFYVQDVNNEIEQIEKAIKNAKKSKKPSFIKVNTIIGEGSILENTNAVHGKVLEKDDIRSLREKLSIYDDAFKVPAEVISFIRRQIYLRNEDKIKDYYLSKENQSINNVSVKHLFNNLESNEFYIDFNIDNYKFSDKYSEDFRDTNQKIMNIIARKSNLFLGGSADLSSSCKTKILNEGYMSSKTPLNRNIAFGVREHAMGSILNGLALSGLRVYGSTFLSFSDYLKPAIRMSAIMNLPVNYIFTHDSILIGQDGPTHQPCEQLISLRSIPNLNVYRPADINELLGVWDLCLKSTNPNAVIISRSKLNLVKGTDAKLLSNGAYMIKKEYKDLDAVLIASGSELETVLRISNELEEYGISTRVVSMVSQELYDAQSDEYKNSLIPKGYLTIGVELSSSNNYYKYCLPENVIGIDSFGYSASKEEILDKFMFSYDMLRSRIEKIIRNH